MGQGNPPSWIFIVSYWILIGDTSDWLSYWDFKLFIQVKEKIAQALFDHIPVGVGSRGVIPMTPKDLDEALEMGMDWSLREGYAWARYCNNYSA